MEITKKVEFLTKDYIEGSQLFRYDFLDLESNLTFSVYPKEQIKIYEIFEPYKIYETKFKLLLQKTTVNDKLVIAWKVKAVDNK